MNRKPVFWGPRGPGMERLDVNGRLAFIITISTPNLSGVQHPKLSLCTGDQDERDSNIILQRLGSMFL